MNLYQCILKNLRVRTWSDGPFLKDRDSASKRAASRLRLLVSAKLLAGLAIYYTARVKGRESLCERFSNRDSLTPGARWPPRSSFGKQTKRTSGHLFPRANPTQHESSRAEGVGAFAPIPCRHRQSGTRGRKMRPLSCLEPRLIRAKGNGFVQFAPPPIGTRERG